MRDLPLNALRAFAAIYSCGGIRAAARELGIAHSSVSRHLSELESRLGVDLIERTSGRGRLAFTLAGQTLGRSVLAGLGEISHTVAALQEKRSATSVSLGAPQSFAVRWLLPRLPALEREHPSIEVSVLVEKRLDDLETGGLDLAVRIDQLPLPGARSEPLMDDALYPVMSPTFWERSGRPEKSADLVGLRLLHDRDPNALWSAWVKHHGPEELDVSRGPRFTSSDLVLRAAMQGQGVALARHRLAFDDVTSGILCRPIPDLAVELPDAYWLVLPKSRQPRPAVRTVIDWLNRQAAIDIEPLYSSP